MRHLITLLTVLFLAACSSGGSFTASEDPVHIRIALQDKNDQTLFLYGRLIIFPKSQRALFFFVNTEARTEAHADPLRKGFGVFDDPMKQITGQGHDYQITVSPESFSRLIDLTDGVDFFVEDPVTFDRGNFQYPDGVQLFSGEQAKEFSLIKGRFEKGSEYLADIDRLFRAESILLNVLWQLPGKMTQIDRPEQIRLMHSLLDTDLSEEKFRELLLLFGADRPFDVSVLEAPLELAGTGEKVLLFRSDRSRLLYNDYVRSMDGKVDGFPIQVLNGTATSRLASRVKDLIHNRGVRVLKTDNYRIQDFATTTAIEYSGDFRKARLLMELLGLSEKQVFFRRRALDLHATVIMGKDFNMKSLLK
jgi:hypothetical protein